MKANSSRIRLRYVFLARSVCHWGNFTTAGQTAGQGVPQTRDMTSSCIASKFYKLIYELLGSNGSSTSDGIDGQFPDGHCVNGDARRQFFQIFLRILKPENRSADFGRRLSVIFAAGQQVAILRQEAPQVKRLFTGHLPVCPNMKTVRLQRLVDSPLFVHHRDCLHNTAVCYYRLHLNSVCVFSIRILPE